MTREKIEKGEVSEKTHMKSHSHKSFVDRTQKIPHTIFESHEVRSWFLTFVYSSILFGHLFGSASLYSDSLFFFHFKENRKANRKSIETLL
jgi:hypothetical protein